MKSSLVIALLLSAAAFTASAAEVPTGPIQIVSASFGAPDATRQISFAETLQATCGPDSTACQAFCSRSFVRDRSGVKLPFTAAPICRVVYRCGGAKTKAIDVDVNERISLTCAAN